MTFELERFAPGMKVDWVPRSPASGAPGGQLGATHGPHAKPTPPPDPKLIINPSQAQVAFDKAREEGTGLRFRATIDTKLSDGRYRITCDDTLETAWVEEGELEVLDSISQLGDIVGPRGRSLQNGLDEIAAEVFICHDCEEPIQGSVHWMGKQARCGDCRNKKLGLA